jgi:hypothetical protein
LNTHFGAGRHDDPEEILRDEVRAQINASHRFDSFADERSQNFVKWCIYTLTVKEHG